MAIDVHPSAVVSPQAEIGDGAQIGPYCVVGPDVVLGANAELRSHVALDGRTTIGPNVRIFPFASVGAPPQDLKYAGEPSRLEIGADVVIREHVTINPGTEGGGMLTRIGDRCLLMIGAHVAHDCRLGDNVVVVNNVLLGGHVVVEDYAIIGGGSAVHQFVRIGRHAMIGGLSGVEQDVIPYGLVMGDRARLSGLNLVGLRRRGFDRQEVQDLRAAYRLLFAAEGAMSERVEDVRRRFAGRASVEDVLAFIDADSARAICQPQAGASA